MTHPYGASRRGYFIRMKSLRKIDKGITGIQSASKLTFVELSRSRTTGEIKLVLLTKTI